MTLLISIFARFGVPQRFQKAAAYIALAVAAIAFLWLAKTLYDRSVIDDHEAKREARAVEARDVAADQRSTDAITNATNEKELHDAIDAAPTGGTLSPAALALNCERLRKLGRVPPACRRESSDGE